MTIELPPYPSRVGPRTAGQLQDQASMWDALADDIDAELAATDAAFGRALDKAEGVAATRNRIASLHSVTRAAVPGRDR